MEEPASLYSIRELFTVARRVNALNPDLFHAPHYTLPFRLRRPSVVTVHDIIHLKFPEYFSPLQRAYASTVIGHACRHATRVITNSMFTRQEILSRFPVDEAKIHVTYPGTHCEFFRQTDDETKNAFRKKYRLEKPYVLYVGSTKPHKDVGTLLNAMAIVRKAGDIDLVCIGERISDNRELLQPAGGIIRSGALRELGRIPREDLAEGYRCAGAVVLPSRYEGFGSPMVEAMAAGAPAIGARGSAISEIVSDGGILFEPGNPAQLADAIGRMLGDRQARAAVTERGRARAGMFSTKECALRTMAVYESALI